MDIKLQATTKDVFLDALLTRLVARCEQTFPACIRCYYLGGSNSDGTAVGHDGSANSSDVDLFVIFYSTMTKDEQEAFQLFIDERRRSSPVQIDAHAYSEDELLNKQTFTIPQTTFLNVIILFAGTLLYGNDIRTDLPPIQFSHYMLDVIESGVFHIGIPRQKKDVTYPLKTPLVFPLMYPDPEQEFYGYDHVPARPDAPCGTRVLVALTGWIATFVLALETGRYAGQKSQCIQLCKQYLPNDWRTQLAATIYDVCKSTWKYALPETPQEREQLQILCREILALENEYLSLVRDYLLDRLKHGTVSEQQRIERTLRSLVF